MISSISIVIPYSFKNGTLLTWMQRRSSEPFKGLWEFPGGKVEKGETPLQAAIREVREEVEVELISEDLKLLTIKHSHPKIDKVIVLNVFMTHKLEIFPKQGVFNFQEKNDFSNIYQQIPAPNIDIYKMLERHFFVGT